MHRDLAVQITDAQAILPDLRQTRAARHKADIGPRLCKARGEDRPDGTGTDNGNGGTRHENSQSWTDVSEWLQEK